MLNGCARGGTDGVGRPRLQSSFDKKIQLICLGIVAHQLTGDRQWGDHDERHRPGVEDMKPTDILPIQPLARCDRPQRQAHRSSNPMTQTTVAHPATPSGGHHPSETNLIRTDSRRMPSQRIVAGHLPARSQHRMSCRRIAPCGRSRACTCRFRNRDRGCAGRYRRSPTQSVGVRRAGGSQYRISEYRTGSCA